MSISEIVILVIGSYIISVGSIGIYLSQYLLYIKYVPDDNPLNGPTIAFFWPIVLSIVIILEFLALFKNLIKLIIGMINMK